MTGDGAKRAFLTIDGVIRKMTENTDSLTRQEWVINFNRALNSLTRVSSEPSSPYHCSSSSSPLASVMSSIESSLLCRLPSNICATLLPLLSSLIKIYVKEGRCIVDQLDVVVRILSRMLIQVYNRPVQESHLGEGLLIQTRLSLPSTRLNMINSAANNMRIIILDNISDDEDENIIVNLSSVNAKHIKHFNPDARTEKMMKKLSDAGVDLVLCSGGVQPRLKQSLRHEDIALVEYIGQEEVRLISDQLSLVTWDTRDQVLECNVVQADTVETVVIGGENMVKIVTSDQYHIVVCGVSRVLSEQYSVNMTDCLKTARTCVTDRCHNVDTDHDDDTDDDVVKMVFDMMDSVGSWESRQLRQTVMMSVMTSLFSLLRIERICYTNKRIQNNIKKADRIRNINDHDSDGSDS